jgi:hypothetical protein
MLTIKRKPNGEIEYTYEKPVNKSKLNIKHDVPVLVPHLYKNEYDLIDIWYDRNYQLIDRVVSYIIHLSDEFVTEGSRMKMDHEGMISDAIIFLYRTRNK